MKVWPRPRSRLSETGAQATNAGDPPVPEAHAVIVINRDPNAEDKDKRIYEVAVEEDGSYQKLPISQGQEDLSVRLLTNIFGEQFPYSAGPLDDVRFTAFGISPIKDEPTASKGSCYLINANRLRPTNAWTVGPWAATVPTAKALRATLPPTLLVATNDGVYRAKLEERIELKSEPAIWQMLRNGAIVGHAPFESGLVPLVNLTAFEPNSGYPADAIRRTGTLDFKWPRGSVIRVKLLRPTSLRNDKHWEALKTKIEGLAKLWLPQPIPLSFDFVGEDEVNYDVLVDLDPLDPPRRRREEEISLPLSDLGTYCQRRPLNEPSMFIGKPKGVVLGRNARGPGRIDGDYFDSDAFSHILLHEFGHVLGLPHLHQHPAWRGAIFAGDPEELRMKIKEYWGLEVDSDYITWDLQTAWPDTPDYSEWPEVSPSDPLKRSDVKEYFEGSLMMGLPVVGLSPLDERPPGLEYRTSPGTLDLRWLAQLYGVELTDTGPVPPRR